MLEKRARGRSTTSSLAFWVNKPWTKRKVVLKGQWLGYFEGGELKGLVLVAGARLRELKPEEADGKPFVFEVETEGEKLLFNADSQESRAKCIEMISRASIAANWLTPEEDARRNLKADNLNSETDGEIYQFETIELEGKREEVKKLEHEIEELKKQLIDEEEWQLRSKNLLGLGPLLEVKNYTWIVGSETVNFVKGKLIQENVLIGINYELSFDLFLSSEIAMNNKTTNITNGFNSEFRNILRFTSTSMDCQSVGDRNPAVFIVPNSRGLHVRMTGNGNPDSGIDKTNDLPLNCWVAVTILVMGNVITISFDGHEVSSTSVDRSNEKLVYPMNCKVYVSDNFYRPCDGLIRYIRLQNL